MKTITFLILLMAGSFYSSELKAQKRNTPEQEHTITPEDGRNKEKENRRKKEEEYQMKRQQHEAIQDKATKKRMKENYKKAKKNANPGRLPWYKRIFNH
jgi:hypothetical protein